MIFVHAVPASKEEAIIIKHGLNIDGVDILQILSVSISIFPLNINSDLKMKLMKVLENPYVTAKGGQIPTLLTDFFTLAAPALLLRGCARYQSERTC